MKLSTENYIDLYLPSLDEEVSVKLEIFQDFDPYTGSGDVQVIDLEFESDHYDHYEYLVKEYIEEGNGMLVIPLESWK